MINGQFKLNPFCIFFGVLDKITLKEIINIFSHLELSGNSNYKNINIFKNRIVRLQCGLFGTSNLKITTKL